MRMLRFGVPRDVEVWSPQGWSSLGSPGMLWLLEDAQVWGPQGSSGVRSPGMLRVPEDAQVWGPWGYSGLGSPGMLQFRAGQGGDTSAHSWAGCGPCSSHAGCGVKERRQRGGGRFLGWGGAGASTQGQLLPRRRCSVPRSALTPRLGPREVVGQCDTPPQPLGGH